MERKMFVAKQRLILFGKLFERGDIISNVIKGKMYTKEQILNKLNEKGYLYRALNEKTEEAKEKIEGLLSKRGRKPKNLNNKE